MPLLGQSVSLSAITFQEGELVVSEDVDAKILNEAGRGYPDEYEHIAVQLDVNEKYLKYPILKHLRKSKIKNSNSLRSKSVFGTLSNI